jgi:hypothetical protein
VRCRESGPLNANSLRTPRSKSNEVLAQLAPDVRWVEPDVTDNKIFCAYMANDEAVVRKHADTAGFSANKIRSSR